MLSAAQRPAQIKYKIEELHGMYDRKTHHKKALRCAYFARNIDIHLYAHATIAAVSNFAMG